MTRHTISTHRSLVLASLMASLFLLNLATSTCGQIQTCAVQNSETASAKFSSTSFLSNSEFRPPNWISSAFRSPSPSDLHLIVLGIAQDGGYPQAGCHKKCCQVVRNDPSLKRFVASLAIVDRKSGERWLLDCSPDFPDQLALLDRIAPVKSAPGITGILLTHAHVGHYTGLIHLGREAMGTQDVPVSAMPRMSSFLTDNGPWSQLIKLDNIRLLPMSAGKSIELNSRVRITPFEVPHRDEFSETVGFRIQTSAKSVVYLPDIDKWSRWDESIEKLIESVDIAYLDGTFFANGEIPGRDMSLIPHPFVQESINRFATLDLRLRNRVRFIHLNHTNPALQSDSLAIRQIRQAGLNIAVQGEVVDLE